MGFPHRGPTSSPRLSCSSSSSLLCELLQTQAPAPLSQRSSRAAVRVRCTAPLLILLRNRGQPTLEPLPAYTDDLLHIYSTSPPTSHRTGHPRPRSPSAAAPRRRRARIFSRRRAATPRADSLQPNLSHQSAFEPRPRRSLPAEPLHQASTRCKPTASPPRRCASSLVC